MGSENGPLRAKVTDSALFEIEVTYQELDLFIRALTRHRRSLRGMMYEPGYYGRLIERELAAEFAASSDLLERLKMFRELALMRVP